MQYSNHSLKACFENVKICLFSVVPNLYMVETVDNQKLAQTLNNHWEKYRRPGKLNVMIQINTSLEESKLTSATSSEKLYLLQMSLHLGTS